VVVTPTRVLELRRSLIAERSKAGKEMMQAYAALRRSVATLLKCKRCVAEGRCDECTTRLEMHLDTAHRTVRGIGRLG
jgi:primosomal protein N'